LVKQITLCTEIANPRFGTILAHASVLVHNAVVCTDRLRQPAGLAESPGPGLLTVAAAGSILHFAAVLALFFFQTANGTVLAREGLVGVALTFAGILIQDSTIMAQ
jgi:hypothetical protein